LLLLVLSPLLSPPADAPPSRHTNHTVWHSFALVQQTTAVDMKWSHFILFCFWTTITLRELISLLSGCNYCFVIERSQVWMSIPRPYFLTKVICDFPCSFHTDLDTVARTLPSTGFYFIIILLLLLYKPCSWRNIFK
jgi:hypothetical protein